MESRIAKWFPYLLLAPAIFPLVWWGGLLYPFLVPKTLLLRGFGIVTLAALVYLVLRGQPFFWHRLRPAAAWIPAALLLVAYLASAQGVDFSMSFWSVFNRGDGLLTLTVIVGYFYCILLYAERDFLPRLLKIVAVVGTIAALIGLLQWVAYIFGNTLPFIPSGAGRVGGPLGNAAFFAGYLGLTIFATLASIPDWDSRTMRRLMYYGAALQALVAVLTATRGTMLALIVTGTLWLVYVAFKKPSPESISARALRAARPSLTLVEMLSASGSVRSFARIALVALVVVAGLFFAFRGPLSQSSFEPVRRIASISFADATVSSRLFIWQNVSVEALSSPLLGAGAEHIAPLFDRVYDPTKILEQWFDRTHNSFLDYFVQYGIFGLALYLALLIAFGASALRLFRAGDNGRLPAGRQGFYLTLLVVAYAVQNFFVFDTAVTLWLLIALFAVLLAREDESRQGSILLRGEASSTFAPIVGLLLLLPLWWVVAKPLAADYLLAQGYHYQISDVHQSVAYFKKGLAFNTYADLEYGYTAYDMYTANQAVLLSGVDRVAAYEYARELLEQNFIRYPYDTRTAVYLGHVFDTAPPEVVVDEEQEREVLTRATLLSPKRTQPYFILANIALKKGDASSGAVRTEYYQTAIAGLEAYAAMVPALAEPHFIIANLYFVQGDRANAAREAALGLAWYRPDTDVAKRAVKYYIAIEDWEHAVRFLADLIVEDPTDYDVLYDLAKVTYLVGDKAAALRIVEQLRVSNPAILETDKNFLAAITAYEQSRN